MALCGICKVVLARLGLSIEHLQWLNAYQVFVFLVARKRAFIAKCKIRLSKVSLRSWLCALVLLLENAFVASKEEGK